MHGITGYRPMFSECLSGGEKMGEKGKTIEIIYLEKGFYISAGIHSMGHFGMIVSPQPR
jgi:hypothetical protein